MHLAQKCAAVLGPHASENRALTQNRLRRTRREAAGKGAQRAVNAVAVDIAASEMPHSQRWIESAGADDQVSSRLACARAAPVAAQLAAIADVDGAQPQ
jgi:type IV pilus biogenesis protein CpaD/CtpE